MQDGRKAVWSIPYVSVEFFPSLKQNLIAYGSSKLSWRPDCIFELHQLWQSGFSRVNSNCCGSCWFEPEIIKIGQSSHKMYNNNIVNFQQSTTILNACTKSLETYWMPYVCLSFYCIDGFRHESTYKFDIQLNQSLYCYPHILIYYFPEAFQTNLKRIYLNILHKTKKEKTEKNNHYFYYCHNFNEKSVVYTHRKWWLSLDICVKVFLVAKNA